MFCSSDRSRTGLDRRTVAEIQERVIEKGERNLLSRLVHANSDKEAVGAWKLDLNSILHVFNVRSVGFTQISLIFPFQTELAVNTHVTVSDIRRDVSKIRKEIGNKVRSVSMSRILPINNKRMLTVS